MNNVTTVRGKEAGAITEGGIGTKTRIETAAAAAAEATAAAAAAAYLEPVALALGHLSKADFVESACE